MTDRGAHLTVLLGGARAGKSAFAERLAASDGGTVTYLATSPRIDGDADLDARIARHRADRPMHWITVEEEIDVASAIREATEGTVLFDCVTTWVANLLHHGRDESQVLAATEAAIESTTRRSGAIIVVTNEVGLGVVPQTELGRAYRDLLGRINQRWVAASDRTLLIVAGRALPLHDPESFG